MRSCVDVARSVESELDGRHGNGFDNEVKKNDNRKSNGRRIIPPN